MNSMTLYATDHGASDIVVWLDIVIVLSHLISYVVHVWLSPTSLLVLRMVCRGQSQYYQSVLLSYSYIIF